MDLNGTIPRRRLALSLLGGAGLVAVGGLVGARFVKSPQQVLAEAAGPPPSLLTAAVERRVLTDTVPLRGQVGADLFDVTPVASGTVAQVVTGVRAKVGDQIEAGAVIIEVAGRPLVALAGPIPMYRDIRPGAEGKDVTQLQEALAALGFSRGGDRRGLFGQGTKGALANFYSSIGYPSATTGEADTRAVDDGRRRVAAAERAVRNASGPAAVAAAQAELADARSALDALLRVTGPMLPLGEAVFLPSFPAQLIKLDARVGAVVRSPALTLSSGPLAVRASLNPAERELVQPGMAVEIVSEVLGIKANGTIASIGELELSEQHGRSYPVVVTSTAELDRRLAGQDVRLTVTAASTADAVLVVPLSAINSGSDGRTAVFKVHPGSAHERVEVIAGVSGDGYVEVRPAVDGALGPGDLVVLGR